MAAVQSFDPLASDSARVLILGSMPGKASLAARQYYAHPRNAFWPIMGRLFEWPAKSDYAARCEALVAEGIALWDVLESCRRESSLDADIVEDSILPNDFEGLLRRCRGIGHIFFNGAKAEQSFRRHVLPDLSSLPECCEMVRLPSTSPAHAALSFEQKLADWQRVKQALALT